MRKDNMVLERDSLLELGIKFHGHLCPAMPWGLRVGLAAMAALGVERAKNKELYCNCEVGDAHAMMCFADGVQIATGCTFGKGNIARLGYSKNAIELIDVKSSRAVRVVCKPERVVKGFQGKFFKLRESGVEPQDVPEEIVRPLVDAVWSAPDADILVVGEVRKVDFVRPKGSFEWARCERCGEVVFGPGLRIVDGKPVCIPCSGYRA